jgi:prepilin-type N-terminal cleavage/methylation domain-containing protein
MSQINQINQNGFKNSRWRICPTKRTNQSGFTLLELLLVIVMIGILASISVGRYNRYVQESNRRAAVAQLYVLQQTMERNRLQTGQYATITEQTIKGYVISGTSNDKAEYLLTATPIKDDGGDMNCGTLSINHQDLRTSSAGDATECWQ